MVNGTGALVTPEVVASMDEEVQEVLTNDDNIVFKPNPGPQTEFLASSETEVLFAGGKGSSKALKLNTIIPTSTGYKTIEELEIGDLVFAEDGTLTPVVAKSEVCLHQTYDLHFDTGEVITADSGHLWKTYNARQRRAVARRTPEFRQKRKLTRPSVAKPPEELTKPWVSVLMKEKAARGEIYTACLGKPEESILTTEEMANKVYTGKNKSLTVNYSVENSLPIELPNADLPIDPYMLSMWLGDGNSNTFYITGSKDDMLETKEFFIHDHQDHEFVSKNNTTLISRRSIQLNPTLKKLGILNNKRIPVQYLRSSLEQRKELLKGILDSDGSCSATKGSCNITLKSRELIEDVQELVCSLGIKTSLRPHIAKCQNGYECEVYHLEFYAPFPVFKLKRKYERQHSGPYRSSVCRRFITKTEDAGVQKVQCITVAHPSHTFLVGRTFIKTHNSYGLMIDPLRYCSCKSFRGIIIRRTIPEVRDMIYKARQLYPKAYPGVAWRDSDKMFVFPSGARVEFMSIESQSDLPKLQGQNPSYIGIDEIADFPFAEELLTYARANLRTVDPEGSPIRLRLTANPGAVASAYIREQFVDKCAPSQTFWEKSEFYDPRTKEKITTHVSKRHIHSTVFDNPYLLQDPKYVAMLSNLPPIKRKQWLLGDWMAAENAAFSEFEDSIHVIQPRDISRSWKRVSGFDWGFSSDSAVVWGAVDPDTQQIIIYREWVFKKKTAMQAAHEGKHIEHGENVSVHILDASAWQRRGTLGESIGETLQNYWGKMLPSSRTRVGGALSRVARKNLIHEYLSTDPATGLPRLVVTSNCRHFIKCIKGVPLDKNNCEMYDTDSNLDHIIDALGYLLQARPVTRSSWTGDFGRQALPMWQPQDQSFGY